MAININEHFGARIKSMRLDLSISQENLAEMMGLDRSTIIKYEKLAKPQGQMQQVYDTLVKLGQAEQPAVITKVSISYRYTCPRCDTVNVVTPPTVLEFLYCGACGIQQRGHLQ